MVVLGGGAFLMSEAPLYGGKLSAHEQASDTPLFIYPQSIAYPQSIRECLGVGGGRREGERGGGVFNVLKVNPTRIGRFASAGLRLPHPFGY